MLNKIEITIATQDESHINVHEWYDGGVWLKIGVNRASVFTALTRDESQQLMEALEAILAKELTA
jgi:predicted alpha-1,6-mannanase (GH76 family)